MSLLVIGAALLVGFLRGHRLADLINYPFRGMGLFAGALAIQLFLGTRYAESLPAVRLAAPLLNLGSMLLLLLAIAANRRLAGARLAGLGVLLNAAVIFANGGKMPVSPHALRTLEVPADRVAHLAAGRFLTHRLMGPEAALAPLADVLYLPPPFVRSSVFSVGDVVLGGGLFLLVVGAMANAAAQRGSRTTSETHPATTPG